MSSSTEELQESISAELLRSCPSVGPVRAASLLKKFGRYTEIIAHPAEIDRILGDHPARHLWAQTLTDRREQIEERVKKFLSQGGTSLIPLTGDRYPPLLREIRDPPLLLYCRGDASLLQHHCVSIVGTRSMTQYGKEACALVTKASVQQDLVIVSGMADGIDCEAHQSALDLGGKTIAVLGTGVEPADHFSYQQMRVYEQVVRRGLVISEVAPGTPRMKGQYPLRNRIIAGCSRKTIVIEAPDRSGALITAWMALEENRDVMAVPGPIIHAQSRGCHKLIALGAEILWDPTQQSAPEHSP